MWTRSAAARRSRGLPAPDLILITHIHGDHFSVPTLVAVAGAKAKLVAAPSVVAAIAAQPGQSRHVHDQRAKPGILDIGVEAMPGYDLTPARLGNHPKGRDNGYVLTMGGKRIYLSGDTEDIPEMLALKTLMSPSSA